MKTNVNNTNKPQHDAKMPVRRTAVYIGSEFPELQGGEHLVADDLNDDNCFIIQVGMDWINSIPAEDLHFA